MTELELQQYLLREYPQENARCEWKEFKNLKNSFCGDERNDVISYVSAIANMEGGYSFHAVALVWEKQSGDRFCQRLRASAEAQFLHYQHVCAGLGQREDRVAEGVDDGVHLPVAESFAVGFRWPEVYARSVGDVRGLRRPRRLLPVPVLEPVAHMARQLARPVGVDVVVYRLLADVHAALAQDSGYLRGRPLLLRDHTLDLQPQDDALAVVAAHDVTPSLCLGLRYCPHIFPVSLLVAGHFAADRALGNSDFGGDAGNAPSPFYSKINFVPLCLN